MIIRSVLPALLALWGLLPLGGPATPAGSVNEVRIAPAGQETEITILTSGPVKIQDFQLADPARLIVDVQGARHALPRSDYEGIGRGGIVRLRTSQFRDDVVRLVFDLSRAQDYKVDRSGDEVHLSFTNPGSSFDPWTTGAALAKARSNSGTAASKPPATPSAMKADVARPASLSEGGSRPAAHPASVRLPVAQASGQPRISVTYDSASMLDVLAGFSEFSGVSIVPSASAAGMTVRGVDIRNQPWDVALDAILSAQGLGWRRMESGIIVVDKLSDLRSRDTLQTETRVFRINYAGADSVAATLQKLATPKGQVVAYKGTNSVIVSDAPPVVARMDSLVHALDRRIPQVSIEAKIVFVDRTNLRNLGIAYDLKDRRGAQFTEPVQPTDQANQTSSQTNQQQTKYKQTFVDLAGASVAAVANAGAFTADNALQILAETAIGQFSLFTFLEALQQHGLTDVQAAPAIQVVDNHTARIQVGEKTPIRILEPQAQLQQATVNVQFEDTGIILQVTPHITNNNQILIDLHAERSEVQDKSQIGGLGYNFSEQTGDSRVLLDNGQTAVIGGLTESTVKRNESGIPLLMDIPVLGSLFKTQSHEEEKRDLIILVTPHIVGPQANTGM
jgi:type IV pilus secretin PilQ/predicted competence protein